MTALSRSLTQQQQFKRPFVLISEKGRRFIVLPPSFAEIIKNEPNLSLDEGVKMVRPFAASRSNEV